MEEMTSKLVVRISDELKAKFEKRCDDMGSNMSVEIRVFIIAFLKKNVD